MTAEYDAVASAYGVSFTSMPYRIYIEEWSVLAALGDIRNTSILDLACGTGHYARRLRQNGASRVVAVDLSRSIRSASHIMCRMSRPWISAKPSIASWRSICSTMPRIGPVLIR